MLRLAMKLALSPIGMFVGGLNLLIGLLLWDKRPFKDADRLIKVIWSKNKPVDLSRE